MFSLYSYLYLQKTIKPDAKVTINGFVYDVHRGVLTKTYPMFAKFFEKCENVDGGINLNFGDETSCPKHLIDTIIAIAYEYNIVPACKFINEDESLEFYLHLLTLLDYLGLESQEIEKRCIEIVNNAIDSWYALLFEFDCLKNYGNNDEITVYEFDYPVYNMERFMRIEQKGKSLTMRFDKEAYIKAAKKKIACELPTISAEQCDRFFKYAPHHAPFYRFLRDKNI